MIHNLIKNYLRLNCLRWQLGGFLGLTDKLMKIMVPTAIFPATAPDAKSDKDIPKAFLDARYSLINKNSPSLSRIKGFSKKAGKAWGKRYCESN